MSKPSCMGNSESRDSLWNSSQNVQGHGRISIASYLGWQKDASVQAAPAEQERVQAILKRLWHEVPLPLPLIIEATNSCDLMVIESMIRIGRCWAVTSINSKLIKLKPVAFCIKCSDCGMIKCQTVHTIALKWSGDEGVVLAGVPFCGPSTSPYEEWSLFQAKIASHSDIALVLDIEQRNDLRLLDLQVSWLGFMQACISGMTTSLWWHREVLMRKPGCTYDEHLGNRSSAARLEANGSRLTSRIDYIGPEKSSSIHYTGWCSKASPGLCGWVLRYEQSLHTL